MTKSEPPANQEPGPVTVSHVADFYNRYPGETLTFYTRFEAREAVSDLTLRVSLPEGLILGDYRVSLEQNGRTPRTEVSERVNYLVWSLEGELPAGTCYEYQTRATLAPADQDSQIVSQATVVAADEAELAQETATVALWSKGKYLQYLPALFEKDDFMRRFVMLFESFWSPIENQIDNIHFYFDPRTTPAGFLPWLASWLDLELDERWPEARLRQLIRWAIALHRSRGTKWGLQKYLEIYTGQQATVTEYISNNFVLGSETRLGPAVALGLGNTPHTFSVSLRLPLPDSEDWGERDREEKLRRRTIESIIDRQKPAHAVYTLDLEFVSPGELAAPAREIEIEEEAAAEIDEIAAQAATWFKLEDE